MDLGGHLRQLIEADIDFGEVFSDVLANSGCLLFKRRHLIHQLGHVARHLADRRVHLELGCTGYRRDILDAAALPFPRHEMFRQLNNPPYVVSVCLESRECPLFLDVEEPDKLRRVDKVLAAEQGLDKVSEAV